MSKPNSHNTVFNSKLYRHKETALGNKKTVVGFTFINYFVWCIIKDNIATTPHDVC